MRFENKVAVVACAASDAGIACAKRYLSEGAKVAVYYDTPERVASLQGQDPEKLLCIQIKDYRDVEELAEAGRKVLDTFGTVDIIVTAITTTSDESPEDMSAEEYQRIMETIATGALYTIQPLVPAMVEKNYGRIVLVSSIAGRIPIKGVSPAFAAANAALGGIARNIGSTMGVHFITGNSVSVGPLEDGSYAAGEPGAVNGILPGRELGKLEDVAGAVEYLTSDLASWTTGETQDLNGGYFMN